MNMASGRSAAKLQVARKVVREKIAGKSIRKHFEHGKMNDRYKFVEIVISVNTASEGQTANVKDVKTVISVNTANLGCTAKLKVVEVVVSVSTIKEENDAENARCTHMDAEHVTASFAQPLLHSSKRSRLKELMVVDNGRHDCIFFVSKQT